jgi:hypothetical protein
MGKIGGAHFILLASRENSPGQFTGLPVLMAIPTSLPLLVFIERIVPILKIRTFSYYF